MLSYYIWSLVVILVRIEKVGKFFETDFSPSKFPVKIPYLFFEVLEFTLETLNLRVADLESV